jgi:hypothetical protein
LGELQILLGHGLILTGNARHRVDCWVTRTTLRRFTIIIYIYSTFHK